MILKAALNLISPVLQMELCYLSSKCHNYGENRIIANVCLSYCIHCVRKTDYIYFMLVLHLCVMNIVFTSIRLDHMLLPIWQRLESSQQAVLTLKKNQQNVPWKFCAQDLQTQTLRIPKIGIWQRGFSLCCFSLQFSNFYHCIQKCRKKGKCKELSLEKYKPNVLFLWPLKTPHKNIVA